MYICTCVFVFERFRIYVFFREVDSVVNFQSGHR